MAGAVCPEDVIVIKAEAKKYALSKADIRILIDSKHVSFVDLVGEKSLGPPPMHFFVYIPEQFKDRSRDLITILQKRSR